MQRSHLGWCVVMGAAVAGCLEVGDNGSSSEPRSGSPGVGGDGSCVPNYSCQPVAPNTGDPHLDCVERINQFRACVCLGPLARNTAAEACADQQAQYDGDADTAHAGFTAKICAPSGVAQNECPGWDSVALTLGSCVQEMFDEGPPPTSACSGSCFETYGHYLNITTTRYTSVACGFYTTASGEVWQTQNYFP